MNIRIITLVLLLATLPVSAQKKKTVVNDSNTPLHLLQPAYQGTYGDLTPGQVKKDIDRVFAYIDKETPARVKEPHHPRYPRSNYYVSILLYTIQ